MNFTLKRSIAIGLLVIAVVIIFFNVYELFKTKEPTDIIHMGKIRNYINTKGVVLRNEKVIDAKENGKLTPSVSEGTRVSVGETIAMLYNNESNDLLQKAENAEALLIDTIKQTLDDDTFEQQSVKKINNTIDSKVDGIIEAEINRDFNSAISYEKDIRFYTEEKIAAIVKQLPPKSYIYQLKKDAENARKNFEQSAGCINSPYAGFVSFTLDNYEKTFSKLYNKDISVSKFEKLTVSNTAKVSKNVKKGKSVAKVITGFEQKIICLLTEKDAAAISLNTHRQIRINDVSLEVTAEVVSKSKPQNGKVVVTLLIDRALDELSNLRIIDIDVAKEIYAQDGLKVPISVLYDWDKMTDSEGTVYETAKILTVKAHFSREKTVKVIIKDDEYAIIDRLGIDGEENVVELYDEYILNPEGIEEGVLIY